MRTEDISPSVPHTIFSTLNNLHFCLTAILTHVSRYQGIFTYYVCDTCEHKQLNINSQRVLTIKLLSKDNLLRARLRNIMESWVLTVLWVYIRIYIYTIYSGYALKRERNVETQCIISTTRSGRFSWEGTWIAFCIGEKILSSIYQNILISIRNLVHKLLVIDSNELQLDITSQPGK